VTAVGVQAAGLALCALVAIGGVATADTGSGSGSDSAVAAGSDAPAPKQTAAIEPPSTTSTITQSSGDPAQQAASPVPAVTLADTRFELHGYARIPLMTQGSRDPYLIDNDPFLSGFAYTRLYEPDWSELFFSANHGNYKAEFGLFASLYSDYAQAQLANQLGIAQASVRADKFLDNDNLSVQVGVFWDRFGYIEPYDTYIFGRTHQGGAKVAYKLPGGGKVQAGIGLHEADLQQNEGTTPIAHLVGAYPIGPLELGAYLLRTWTTDTRPLSPIQDGTMYVAGVDGRYKTDRVNAYGAFSYDHMDHVLYLAPSLELMNSMGGQGITENYLGLDMSDDGTGRMYVGATDVKVNVADRVHVRAFGMVTWVRSPQVDVMDALENKDRRLYLKWGAEPSYDITPRLRASVRYDRVILDMYDGQDSFHVLSPKISFPLDNWGEVFVQYSHYWYGDKIELRPGQVPLVTEPDSNVVKLQAQVVW
jgi:hypothetical protein